MALDSGDVESPPLLRVLWALPTRASSLQGHSTQGNGDLQQGSGRGFCRWRQRQGSSQERGAEGLRKQAAVTGR